MKVDIHKNMYEIDESGLLYVKGGASNFDYAKNGAMYGAALGVGFCTAAGFASGGITFTVAGACRWIGAKFGGAIGVIANNL